MTNVWQVVALLFAVGWFVTPLEASIGTIMQTATRDRERGRVAATLHAVMSAASVLSMALAGVFGDLLTIRTVYVLAGVVVGIAALVAWLMFRGVDLAAVAADDAGPAAGDAHRAPAEASTAVEDGRLIGRPRPPGRDRFPRHLLPTRAFVSHWVTDIGQATAGRVT